MALTGGLNWKMDKYPVFKEKFKFFLFQQIFFQKVILGCFSIDYFLFILNVETVLFLYISKFELCRWARRRSETNISAHNVCVCRHLWRLATPAT